MKANKFIFVVAGIVALWPVLAWGDLVSMNSFGVGAGSYGSYGSSPGGRGGEFNVTAGGLGTFNTFCIELNEQVAIGGTYNFTLGDSAVAGGAGGPSPDPLSPQTAYLYYHYWLGDLDTFVSGYSYGNNASADALQYALWFLEEEVSVLNTGTLAEDLVNFANSTAWTDIGPVRVMRLTGGNTQYQDQLAVIPAPGAVFLGVIGFGFMNWMRRK